MTKKTLRSPASLWYNPPHEEVRRQLGSVTRRRLLRLRPDHDLLRIAERRILPHHHQHQPERQRHKCPSRLQHIGNEMERGGESGMEPGVLPGEVGGVRVRVADSCGRLDTKNRGR